MTLPEVILVLASSVIRANMTFLNIIYIFFKVKSRSDCVEVAAGIAKDNSNNQRTANVKVPSFKHNANIHLPVMSSSQG